MKRCQTRETEIAIDEKPIKIEPPDNYQSTSTAPPPLPSNLKFNLFPNAVPAKKIKSESPMSFERFVSINHAMKHKGRNMSLHKKSITEAAKINGIETISHTSGAQFAIPLSMQAHPIKLTDTIPDEQSDILNQKDALPYCPFCHSVVKTWQGYEYHVLKEHVKYRAYRCLSCPKETFYTEEEGRFHMSFSHPDRPVLLAKENNKEKEDEATDAFRFLMMIMRDGPTVNTEKIKRIQDAQVSQICKFSRLRFKIPSIVVRSKFVINKVVQTQIVKPTNNYVSYGLMKPYNSTISSLRMLERTGDYTSILQREKVLYRTARK